MNKRMFSLFSFLSLIFMCMFSANVIAENINMSTQYRLSAGDVLKISVFGEPDLSIDEVRLNDAGTFSYPFLGEMQVRGLTASQVEAMITERLQGDYLVNPRVSVSIIEYREFFISGEVRNPGGYPYQPGLTLRRAVALAGGLTERASQRRMSIIRDGDANRTSESANMDTLVMPGDIITIDQGFF